MTAQQNARPDSRTCPSSSTGTSLPRCTPWRSEYVTRTLVTSAGRRSRIAASVSSWRGCVVDTGLDLLGAHQRVRRRRLVLQGLVERRDAVVLDRVARRVADAVGVAHLEVGVPDRHEADADQGEDDAAVVRV